MDYTDIQISIDGADAATNDAVRGEGSFATAIAAMDHLAAADFGQFKISVVMTRKNIGQLDRFEALAARYGAELRLTRLRPAGRGADTWHELHPLPEQQVELYHWLIDRPTVLTGDSFFHLNALGDENLPGLNLCGAGRVVCLDRSRSATSTPARSSSTTTSGPGTSATRAGSRGVVHVGPVHLAT